MHSANEVLDFWFGPAPSDAARLAERSTFWFGGDGPAAVAARDAEIRARLEPTARTRGARRVRELGGFSPSAGWR